MRLLLAVMVISVLACSSSVEFPPVSPEDVEVYMSDTLIRSPDGDIYRTPPGALPGEYVVVWRTTENVRTEREGAARARDDRLNWWNTYPLGWSDDQVVEHLRGIAAEHGADALLIDLIDRAPGGEVDVGARAVCFLARHPELAKK